MTLLALVALTPPAVATDQLVDSYFVSPRYDVVPEATRVAENVDASLDRFAAEAAAERVAARLSVLGADLRDARKASSAVLAILGDEFAALGWGGQERVVYRGRRFSQFTTAPALGREMGKDLFVAEFRSLVGAVGRIGTTEFEIVRVEPSPAHGSGRVRTEVHFDWVGITGELPSERKVQQAGDWIMDWAAGPAGEWRVVRWEAGPRHRSIGAAGLFVDVTRRALGGNPSYDAQLRHGVDHWRSRLDGALGIDVYGHHGVSAGDIDGDGDDDLHVAQPAGLPNRVFRNDGGLRFTDITESTGLGVLDSTSMALLADWDGDDDQDLVLITGAAPFLMLNAGGRFSLAPAAFAGGAWRPGS